MSTSSPRLTLTGSAALISDLLYYSVNSILFQRGIYPPDMFQRQRYHNVPLMLLKDNDVDAYFTKLITDLTKWLDAGLINQFVLAIINKVTGEVVETWKFNIDSTFRRKDGGMESNQRPISKPESEIVVEVQSLMKQITASVSFLPLLDFPCTIDIQVHVNSSSIIPKAWRGANAHCIETGEETVPLRPVITNIHNVTASVSYKVVRPEDFINSK